MVSLAFVISFVASAVALLIGIIIYSDISDEIGNVLNDGGISQIIQLLGQNTATSDQPVPTKTTNLASVYIGLNSTDFVTAVAIPISGVETSGGSVTQDSPLYMCGTNTGTTLREVDKLNGTTTNTVSMFASGCQGLSVNPIDGQMYISSRSGGGGTSSIGTLDPVTGAGSFNGNSGDLLMTMAFDDTGTLFAVSGLDQMNCKLGT